MVIYLELYHLYVYDIYSCIIYIYIYDIIYIYNMLYIYICMYIYIYIICYIYIMYILVDHHKKIEITAMFAFSKNSKVPVRHLQSPPLT